MGIAGRRLREFRVEGLLKPAGVGCAGLLGAYPHPKTPNPKHANPTSPHGKRVPCCLCSGASFPCDRCFTVACHLLEMLPIHSERKSRSLAENSSAPDSQNLYYETFRDILYNPRRQSLRNQSIRKGTETLEI